ncbi:amino acid adenylation domain-containing protein [Lysobacter arenosi]|uniref:Amino acid adenylation domain-containing protein n=1 Tax=Lysobacter arenosi TaxID=2795387 RepID=A0ABX7RBG1_9GAMM|nr:non-ribosomal peptide synthetase [Lysobacter arenosi]QSX75473.1 amino acid adenylation domain-containing protein [Lysobacter arenosi]
MNAVGVDYGSLDKASPADAGVDYDPFAEGGLARVAPTTEPQREVWLADRLGRDASLAYNESISLHFHGRLDADAVRTALRQLVARHDVLRSNFGPDGKTLCVAESVDFDLASIDLSGLTPDQRDARVAAHAREVVETPFELDHGLLLRAELLRLSDEEHLLVLTAHHLVCDGWSWWVIVRELGTLYTQALWHATPPLPAAESFADYALAEAEHPSCSLYRDDEAYWCQRFADGGPILDLPTDRPRPPRRTFASIREDHVLDDELVAAIRRLGARHGASLFATLLAGFAGLLTRLTAQSDVVVGIPAAAQSLDGHDHLVGHCVNLLPLRFELDLTQPFEQALAQAQETLLDSIEHQRYTFGTLLRKLPLQRDPARLPLVSVMFNIDQALDQEHTGFHGLSMQLITNPRSYENFELFVNAVQVRGGMRLECQYNTDLFDNETVRRWLRAYETLLRSAVARPDMAYGKLPLVSESAREELLALQPAATPFDRECRMHEFFERQCERTPDRVAVRFNGEAVSYASLEARANRIAHLLRARGVHRGALVGLVLDRGVDMLAGLLGVLKCGAGYVPLDPNFPAERLAYMAGDAGLAALLTTQSHAGNFDLRGRPVLALDRLDDELAAMPATPIGRDDAAAQPESIAYVIYTSGSTGRPKGVQVPHRAVSNFLTSMREEPGLGIDDRLVAVTTLSFDIAVLELMLPLSVGAEVILADRVTAADGVALAALLKQSGATVMQATPASWRLLLDAEWKGDASFKILCGGEALPVDLAAQLLQRCGSLWNVYGPTETTVWSTCARIVAPAPGQSTAAQPIDIHIGRPIANTQVWILDPRGELCPLGVPGEIWIGGDGVTQGYLNRPELTGERFVADPFSPVTATVPSPLLYRTGDRGRWRADGVLEHMGRLDFQVKVRGYRIELGEIEALLAAHPQVARTVVVAREDRPGDVRLVAYAVLQPGAALTDAELASYLKSSLPDYMIPQHIMFLEAIPLLPNGKIDRNSLPVPDMAVKLAGERVAPRNALERSIAQAMAQVLGVAEVGVDDDFFSLGGHSLLAAQLTSRINKELGISLSLRALFDGPTVARLARLVSEHDGEAAPPREPIVALADQSHGPMSVMQERLYLLEQFNPGQITYNTPSAHRLRGPLDVAAFQRAVNAMIQRQSALRTTIGIVDGEPVQVIHDSVELDITDVEDVGSFAADQRDKEVSRRMDVLIQTPFELDRSPLIRSRLFRLGPEEHVWFFMTHHLIWDGWSFDLMYTDMAELYAAQLEQREPSLPELPVSYLDFSVWHRQWLQGPEYARQLAFWRERLGNTGQGAAGQSAPGPGMAALPTDMPRRPGMSGRGVTHRIVVSEATTQKLHDTALKVDATLYMVLLTAYFTLISRTSGLRELIVGTPVRGRNTAEVENLMGYFTSLLPLRMEMDQDLTFAQAVKQVKDVVLDSFAHPDIRLEDLVRELSVRSREGGAVLYHALFSFQDIRQRMCDWGPLRHERYPVFQTASTQDLGLWFVEQDTGLSGGFIYNADIFLDETTALLRDRYIAVLEALGNDPSRTLAELTAFDDGQPLLFGKAPVETTPALAAETVGEVPEQAAAVELDPLGQQLLAIWRDLLRNPRITPDDDFFALGGHSLQAVQMFHRFNRETDINLPLATLLTARTVRALAEEYRRAGAHQSGATASASGHDPWSPLVPIRPQGDQLPLFLIHAVGGNVLNYRSLADAMPQGIPVYGLQALGLDGRTSPLTSVEKMAERYVREIRSVQPQGPYHLAGGSMGGIIAYEIAQQLVAAGERVGLLGLIDTSAEFGLGYREQAQRGLGARVQRLQQRLQGQTFSQRLATISGMVNGRIQARQLRQQAQQARTSGAELPHNVRYAEIEATHMRAYIDYVVRPYPAAMVLFRASEQPPQLHDKPALGWESMVGAVEVIAIPGDHRGMIEAPVLVQTLSRVIRRAQHGQAGQDEQIGSTIVPVTPAATVASDAVAVGRDDARAAYLRGLWKELLGVDVGDGDNFFDLGGNSMLAVQMSSRVAKDTGVRIQLMRLATQSLAQIAAELPVSFASEGNDGVGAKMARKMKRLLRAAGTVES